MKMFFDLTKAGIILFVLLSGLAGYALSLPVGIPVEHWQAWILLLGLYLLSAGSFAINQAQEWRIDLKMARTQKRPLPSGALEVWQAYLLGFVFCLVGLGCLSLLSSLTAGLGLITVVLYNGLYTLYWKKRWTFAAVPGAIPGAMPVVIGFSVNNSHLLSAPCVYLFLVMFLWQMPHFWCLAIRYRKDYADGGIPVLPVSIGVERTLYHIGLYTFVYAGLALASPWFVSANVLYLLLVVPLSLKVIYEFFKFFRASQGAQWLPFFLWVNLSVLVFVAAPVFDRWLVYTGNF